MQAFNAVLTPTIWLESTAYQQTRKVLQLISVSASLGICGLSTSHLQYEQAQRNVPTFVCVLNTCFRNCDVHSKINTFLFLLWTVEFKWRGSAAKFCFLGVPSWGLQWKSKIPFQSRLISRRFSLMSLFNFSFPCVLAELRLIVWRQQVGNHANTGDVRDERFGTNFLSNGSSTRQPDTFTEERILPFTDNPLSLPPRGVFIPGPLVSFGEGTLRQAPIRVPGALVSNAITSHRIISEQRLLTLRNNMSPRVLSPRYLSRPFVLFRAG